MSPDVERRHGGRALALPRPGATGLGQAAPFGGLPGRGERALQARGLSGRRLRLLGACATRGAGATAQPVVERLQTPAQARLAARGPRRPPQDAEAARGEAVEQGQGGAAVDLPRAPQQQVHACQPGIEVDGSNAVGTLEAWLEDPAPPGTLVQVGLLTPEDDGELEYERDTSDGESLPFGVATAADLVGLAVEVRRASDGAVLFAGTTPPLRID
jgi:hypothetical protein